MTDHTLAHALLQANGVERGLREWRNTSTDRDEKDAAVAALRHATALRKSLESCIGARAMRAVTQ